MSKKIRWNFANGEAPPAELLQAVRFHLERASKNPIGFVEFRAPEPHGDSAVVYAVVPADMADDVKELIQELISDYVSDNLQVQFFGSDEFFEPKN
jgi:hypothetical protein